VAQAERIGTLVVSNIPDQDCCQLFTPKHPSTRVRVDTIERAEQALPIEAMVDAAVAGMAVEDFQFPLVDKPGDVKQATVRQSAIDS
jgi:thiamine biosynthesis protein ThiI